MKIIIAPDKFKGSLTAKEVCATARNAVLEVFPEAKVQMIPLADGGEGSLELLIEMLDLDFVELIVSDPLFRPVSARYGISGSDAYIEMARAAGLQLLNSGERSAMNTSSVGVGELMMHALDHGAENVYLFVGGSATNDGGMGMAHGLGYRFFDATNTEIVPVGANLQKVTRIASPNQIRKFNLTIVSDVMNPLLGSNGATHQYGHQKGATNDEIELLESGMTHLAGVVSELYKNDVSDLPGCGAAGGISLCGVGLMNGVIKNGIATLLEVSNFHKELENADLVITGEGKMDEQTMQGKVVHGVAQAASELMVPVAAICGDSTIDQNQIDQLKLEQILKLKTDELSVDYCMRNATDLIRERIIEFLRNR